MCEERAVYLASISEAEFQQSVVEFLESMGYVVWYARDSRRQQLESWVDVWAIKAGRPMICWEIKTQTGRLRPERWRKGRRIPGQAEVLGILARVPGVWAMCLRPAEWDAVVERLKREEGIACSE